jgi:hypothetical protein
MAVVVGEGNSPDFHVTEYRATWLTIFDKVQRSSNKIDKVSVKYWENTAESGFEPKFQVKLLPLYEMAWASNT